MERIPIVICIDVEPDVREVDPNSQRDWKGFESTFEFFKRLRPRLANVTRSTVHFSWFLRMDPQIAHCYGSPGWVAHRYRSLIEELEKEGDEIGIHTHAWRWDEASESWFTDLENQQWVDHCVTTSFEAFGNSVNRPCLSFRFGDHWMNNRTSDLVERLGARFDLTAEPGPNRFLSKIFAGSTPDCACFPRQAYRPSRADFRKRGICRRRKLWIVPLSTSLINAGRLARAQLHGGKGVESAGDMRASPDEKDNRSAIGNTEPLYEGFLDSADCQMISGWAYDPERPDESINVEIYDAKTLLRTAPANTFRPDLLREGKGNGKHSFGLASPASLQDGKPHSIWAKVEDSSFELRNGAAARIESLMLLNTKPWLMSQGINSLLSGLKNPYLALPVRSEVSLYPTEFLNLKENFDYLVLHPLAKRFVFETPAELVARLG